MALTDDELYQGLTTRYVADFEAGKASKLSTHNFLKYCTEVTDVSAITDPVTKKRKIVFTQPHAKLRRHQGEVQFRSLPLDSYEIEIEPFMDAVEEDLSKLRDPVIQEAYSTYASTVGENVRETQYGEALLYLLNGDTALRGYGYDGQFFFDTDHPGAMADGTPTTYSNLFDLPLSEANLETVLATMASYRNENGVSWGNVWRPEEFDQDPMNDRGMRPTPQRTFRLTVGPALAKTGQDLMKYQRDNPSAFSGAFTLSVEPDIEGSFANYWFVHFIDPRRRPLIFFNAGSAFTPTIGYMTEPGRLRKKAQWVTNAEWAFAYKDWHSMAMCRN